MRDKAGGETLIEGRDVYWRNLELSAQESIKGRTAVIAGGGGDIGRVVVENFIEKGAEVVIVSRTEGEEVAENMGERCSFKPCNLRNSGQTEKVIENIVKELGSIDILINCVGKGHLAPVSEESEEAFDRVVETNFKVTRNLTSALAENLTKTKGSIVNLSSISGLTGVNLPWNTTYSAANAAVIKYSEVAAEELEKVDVNCISTAPVNTSMTDKLTEEEIQTMVDKFQYRDSLIQTNEIADIVESVVESNLDQKNIVMDYGYIENI